MKTKSNKTKLYIFPAILILLCFGFASYAKAEYFMEGNFLSTNLLSGQTVVAINTFNYIATLPASTAAQVQFSEDGATWYNSSGTQWGWDSLSAGSNSIDLKGLDWRTANFYYRVKLETTDNTATPLVSEASIDYDAAAVVVGEVDTVTPEVMSSIKVRLKADITYTGGADIDERGFEWGTSTGVYTASTTESGTYAIESYNIDVSTFSVDTTYYYRAMIHNSAGWAYGDEVSFDTPATAYSVDGNFVSTNLLSGGSVNAIQKFGYNITSLEAGTSVKAQFSQDGSTWYNSSGTQWGWDTLVVGDHLSDANALSLATLSWTGANFYYQLLFETTDNTKTPVLSETNVHYSKIYVALSPNPPKKIF